MKLLIAFYMLALVSAPASAQYDFGVGVGGVLEELRAFQSDDPHRTTWVGDVGRTAFSASAFYRERYSEFVDLGFDLTFAHRCFDASYSEGGLGASVNRTVHAELDQLYIGVKPEVRMDAKRRGVVRFGLMVGFLVGGAAKGTASSWSMIGPSTRIEDADLIRDFGGDIRFAFGLGFRVPLSERWAIAIDPETTIAFSSMLKAGAGMRGSDIGLRIGLSRRSNREALTSLFKVPPQDRFKGSAW